MQKVAALEGTNELTKKIGVMRGAVFSKHVACTYSKIVLKEACAKDRNTLGGLLQAQQYEALAAEVACARTRASQPASSRQPTPPNLLLPTET